MPSDCNGVCFQQIFEKNLEFTSEVWVFSLFCEFQHLQFMTSWLLIFVSAKPSQTVLPIDRSEPRFESHTGGKMRKTLNNDENIDVFLLIFG